ncbi:ly6/PLAUR domain-containing protein 6B-like [Geothlypis trichas]
MPGMAALRRALTAAVLPFLPFLILSGPRAAAENINFHNIRPPLGPTPFPNSFKCFTCDNAVDNYNCNRWAEDRWCPESTRYCLSSHRFTARGESTSVTKRCATGEECHRAGCQRRGDSGHTVSNACLPRPAPALLLLYSCSALLCSYPAHTLLCSCPTHALLLLCPAPKI